jgi:hypothetical protein
MLGCVDEQVPPVGRGEKMMALLTLGLVLFLGAVAVDQLSGGRVFARGGCGCDDDDAGDGS